MTTIEGRMIPKVTKGQIKTSRREEANGLEYLKAQTTGCHNTNQRIEQ